MINRVGISAPLGWERHQFPSDCWCSLISPRVLLVAMALGTQPMKVAMWEAGNLAGHSW